MDQDKDFYIVGIGTSAGGLEALERFFSGVPSESGAAYVVVQHLSPDYKSHMVELLSKYTLLPVFEAQDGMTIEPNTIYLIPRRKNMTIFKRRIYLVDYDRSQGLNLPIDIFFESLAKDQGEKAVGVILSGTGSDGTRGIRAIKESGGMVMAQDESARFDGMPRSAISTQLVDYVARPEDMPISLVKYIKHPFVVAPEPIATNGQDEVTMGKLFAILRGKTEIDFTDYKPNTIVRRIGRRMSINQVEQLSDYVDYLQHSPEECQILYKEFLIGVTRFFRDPEAFGIIKQKIVPQLIHGKKRHDQIRVWVTGCSTGEEAYSLAILFQEHMEQSGNYVDVKIFATDIDRAALEYASKGNYPESVTADVSPDRLQNFFLKKGDTYEVLRHIRSMVVFAYQNLIKDPPFSKMHLISCRNLLIYLQPNLQRKVLDTFQFALNPQGYLFLGNSETLGTSADVFSVVNNRWRIYQYEGGASPKLLQTQLSNRVDEPIKAGVRDYRQPESAEDWRSSDPVLRSMVEQMLPPCVVVDENQVVVHAFGDVRPYLQAPTGLRVSLNLQAMVRQELALPLSTALHRSIQRQEEVVYSNIKLQDDDQTQYINVTTRPFWERNNRQRLVLILFQPTVHQPLNPALAEEFNVSETVSQRIENLEQELQYTKENLQATIEELETSNEELQATNEELLAANEELQSTNEELQSVNEELTTVNTEYQLKIRELTNLNNDVNNLLSSTQIGTIFLDTSLNVRKFTPAAQIDVNLLPQDVGRPFEHISHHLVGVDFQSCAKEVLDTLHPFQEEVRSHTGRWVILKIIPYITHTNLIDGVVISMIDVSRRKQAEESLTESEHYFRLALKHTPVVIFKQNPQLRYTWAYNFNTAAQIFDDVLGKTDAEVFVNGNAAELIAVKKQVFETGLGVRQNVRVTLDNQEYYYDLKIDPIYGEDGDVTEIMCASVDITQAILAKNRAIIFEEAISARFESIIITDFTKPDNPIVYANPAFEQLTGYSAKEVLGKNCRFMRGDDHDQPGLQLISQAVKRGEMCQVNLRNYRRDGTMFWNQLTIYPLSNEVGQITHFVGVQHDVTALVEGAQ